MSTSPDPHAPQNNDRYFALALRLSEVDGRMTITVEGDLDLATVPFLRAALSAAERVDPAEVVIDVAGLEFVGVSGSRALHDEVERVNDRGRSARMTGASPTIERLLGLTSALSWLDHDGMSSDGPRTDDADASAEASAVLARTVRTLVPDARSVSVCGLTGNRWTTLAATDPLAVHLEKVQFRDRSGPCVDAVLDHQQIACDDLRNESRWNRFVSAALAQHVLGVVSFPLPDGPARDAGPGGLAVTVYAEHPHVLDAERRSHLAAVVDHAVWLVEPLSAGTTTVGGVR